MATVGTLLYTWWKGEQVGEDLFGNRYYVEKGKATGPVGRRRRWVVYKGKPEASKVPANWHIWLHYTTDDVPSTEPAAKQSWEKPHLPNLTGSEHAYKPAGAISNASERQKASGDYQAWSPE